MLESPPSEMSHFLYLDTPPFHSITFSPSSAVLGLSLVPHVKPTQLCYLKNMFLSTYQ